MHRLSVLVLPLIAFGGSFMQATAGLVTLASFKGDNGSDPIRNLARDSAGNLYGTTSGGGAYGHGTVFKISSGTNTLTTLVSFDGANGHYPIGGPTLDPAGNLYGTTHGGGVYGLGTVFKIEARTNSLSTLVDFSGDNGARPIGGLAIGASGELYGTTALGGVPDQGTVFRVNSVTGGLTTLIEFDYEVDGIHGSPEIGVALDPVGNIYGGAISCVFKIDATTNTISSQGNDSIHGPFASGVILDADGNLYGTSFLKSPNIPVVFRIDHGTGVLQVLAQLDTGSAGGLVMDSAGNLYGTTPGGGEFGLGSIFKVEHGTNRVTTLVSFDGANGSLPAGALLLDDHGNLYGTTRAGGTGDVGTVFVLEEAAVAAPEPGTFLSSTLAAIVVAAYRGRQSWGGQFPQRSESPDPA